MVVKMSMLVSSVALVSAYKSTRRQCPEVEHLTVQVEF